MRPTAELHRAASCEASLAENRAATLLNGTGLERNLAGSAALCADCVMHLARSACTLVLAISTASLAALWSAQVLAGVEFLLTISEGEGSAAVAAGDLLISHTREKERK